MTILGESNVAIGCIQIPFGFIRCSLWTGPPGFWTRPKVLWIRPKSYRTPPIAGAHDRDWGSRQWFARHRIASKFGAVIRRIRKQRDMTIRDLAGRVQMNASHLADLEAGFHMPSLRLLLEIAEALDVRAADIVDEVETTFRPKKTQ